MNLDVRSERPGDAGDAAAIEAVHAAAFGGFAVASLVGQLRRSWSAYDPRLSILAWDGDRPVGHALLLPCRMALMGDVVPAVIVGPVGVAPDRQRQGVGRAVLEHGHTLATETGFAFALLAGHPEYYPKLGYRPSYAFPHLTLDLDALPQTDRKLHARPVQPADVPWLEQRMAVEMADLSLGLVWSGGLATWTLPGLDTAMWCQADGQRVAYVAARPTFTPEPGLGEVHLLLAEDAEAARAAVCALRPPKLGMHPDGWLARQLDPAWFTADAEMAAPAMARELQPGALAAYAHAVDQGDRLPGHCTWPLPFLLA